MATGVAAMAVAALLGACGGDDESSSANEPSGTYELSVTEASFPTDQQLGNTYLLRIGVRNDSDRTLPSLAVTTSIAGEAGRTSSLPFGVRERMEGLAQPDRPVWVLADRYPKFDGVDDPGGADTANPKTFELGELKAGETTTAVWKLSAVKAGRYTVRYQVDAGLTGSAKAKTPSGVVPGGTFAVEIDRIPPDTEVTDSGEIVEIPEEGSGGGGAGGATAGDAGEGGRAKARVVPRNE